MVPLEGSLKERYSKRKRKRCFLWKIFYASPCVRLLTLVGVAFRYRKGKRRSKICSSHSYKAEILSKYDRALGRFQGFRTDLSRQPF